MPIFDYQNYRDCLKDLLSQTNKDGSKGVLTALAKAINVHSSLLSMILSGKRDLSAEQAFDVCQYFELTPLESDYFTLLVQQERAGTKRLKVHLKKKLMQLQQQSKLLKSKVSDLRNLTNEEQSVFYSSWLYSAIHLYCGISANGKSLAEISYEFKRPRAKVTEILEFLCRTQLLKEEHGLYVVTEKSTALGLDSPHLVRHHQNWRNRSLLRIDDLTENELMVTAPFSISRGDFMKIRELMMETVKKSTKIIHASQEELLACLNIDLFYVNGSTTFEEEGINEDK